MSEVSPRGLSATAIDVEPLDLFQRTLAKVAAPNVPGNISTPRRVEYALGFISLGLLNEASDELDAIASSDRFLPGVLAAGIELHMAARHWDVVIGLGRELATQRPQEERPWICWAYALRELNRTAEAREVLLTAEPMHGRESAVLHYNLACYASLLGEFGETRKRLEKACGMEKNFKQDARADPDLEGYWKSLE